MGYLASIRAALNPLFRIGVSATMDPRYAKRVILANQIAITLAILCILHVYLDKAMGSQFLALLNIPVAVAYLSIVIMNRLGWIWFSRIALITFAACDVMFYNIAL